MADIKISQLGEAAVVTDSDVFPMTADGVTVKTPASVMKEYVVGDSDISGIGDGSVTGAISTDHTMIQRILGNFAHYESTTTASRPYKVGEYLTYNGYLYRVTAEIASGGTITVGTNVMQTTVGDEIQGGKIWIQAKSISNTSGSSGTLCIITDPLITSDHVLTKFVAANRTVITSDVSCTPSPGQAVLTGVSTATTTAEIMLERPDKVL